jgi:hypothetical protein
MNWAPHVAGVIGALWLQRQPRVLAVGSTEDGPGPVLRRVGVRLSFARRRLRWRIQVETEERL